MDLNLNKKRVVTPYWVINFTNTKETNPIFIDDINVSKLVKNENNTHNWLNFLKTSTKPNNNLVVLDSNFTKKKNHSENTYYSPDNLININFLRYERLYTKLKYSRSPAFDIVSGGAAALLAGFVGFLISEKFGFELVDSGDFYYLFMYGVFASFMLKPLLYIINVNESVLKTLSYRNIIQFFTKLILLSFSRIKSLLGI